MSTPDNAWKILTSDAETDVGSYYVTLPADVTHPTRPPNDTFYEEKLKRLDSFENWKENPDVRGPDQQYDADKAAAYPTLFDYWVSEIYEVSPIMTGLDADYIIVNLAVEKLSEENVLDLYMMKQKGGDETKAFWFMKIADLHVFDYYNRELSGYSDKFWNETLLGHLIPLTPIAYIDPNNTELQSKTFKPGYLAIYVKDIKFPTEGDGPFQLVYLPPSFEKDIAGPLTGPLIYKINKDYNPNQ